MGASGGYGSVTVPPEIRSLSDRAPLLLIFLRHFG
jgi:hypothetical protein